MRLLRQRHLVHGMARRAHALDVAVEALLRPRGDHRTDIDRQPVGIAQPEFGHRALEHGHDPVGDVVLQAEHAQRRAALACRIERRGQRIEHELLGQGRRIGDHRVLPAGLGDQHRRPAVGIEPLRELPVDRLRHFGRAGEHHAVDRRIADQPSADLAVAGQKLQRRARHARLVQDRHGERGDQRRLLGRLGDHRIARGQRARDLAGEDRQAGSSTG